MKITAARGAIAITLDRPRILFFPMEATFALVKKFGPDFLAALYSVDRGRGGALTLNSPDALRYFLWAGLQAEISDTGETLTEDDVAGMIFPWTLKPIFNALVMALTGANSTPALPGKSEAVGSPASPAAAASRRASTSRRGKGSSRAS